MASNSPPYVFSESRSRNILSLSDRIEVIREYERHVPPPSYQSLAKKFMCSSKQIKNILRNRNTILNSYQATDGAQKSEDVQQKWQQKVDFLGKVIYEYIQRALYHNYTIDDEKVRQKALQVKDCIALENFQPTYSWLQDFKRRYGIPAFDLQSLRENVVITEAKSRNMSAVDMIQYVTRMEQEAQQYNGENSNHSNADICDDNDSNQDIDDSQNFDNSLEPKIVYEIEEEEEDEELQKLSVNDEPLEPSKNNHNTSNHMPAIRSATKRRASSPLPDIQSVDEALKHIKALEDYAMLNDNFRAIGLLTQLEQIFKKQTKK